MATDLAEKSTSSVGHRASALALGQRLARQGFRSHAKGCGVNALVDHAAGLFMLVQSVQGQLQDAALPALQTRFLACLEQFTQQCADYLPAMLHAARYALCALMDDTMAQQGMRDAWKPFHLVTHVMEDGRRKKEAFYRLLQQLMAAPAENIDVLELYYLVLAQGFFGRQRKTLERVTRMQLLSDHLYQLIRSIRGDAPKWLSRPMALPPPPAAAAPPRFRRFARGLLLLTLVLAGTVMILTQWIYHDTVSQVIHAYQQLGSGA